MWAACVWLYSTDFDPRNVRSFVYVVSCGYSWNRARADRMAQACARALARVGYDAMSAGACPAVDYIKEAYEQIPAVVWGSL
jgi:hypothetical protein